MSAFTSNPITDALENTDTDVPSCRQFRQFLPSFTPVLYNLSVTSSNVGKYVLIVINGKNFLPNGITYVNFGNFKNISVIYYSSFQIGFIIPQMAVAGNYAVVAVNIYSPKIAYTYLPNLNFSNPLTYLLT